MDQLFNPPEEPAAGPAQASAATGPGDAPLAARMRPARLEDVIGQDALLRPGSALRTSLESGHPHSMLLHGPPGSGKTTIARLVAATTDAAFEELSAVAAGRAEVRAVIERADHRWSTNKRATILFLDEIHRFNKAQQDTLLPAVEEGLITLIGATTENPSYEVNGALLSRLRVYELAALDGSAVARILQRALDAGALGDGVTVQEDALEFLAARADGDARSALAALELAAETAQGEPVTLARAEDAMQRRAIRFDRGGDHHYDTISAWIKATRGSDPDASLYYLAVMLEGGENPRFIARRMVILASEDVGNADPAALPLAVAAAAAVEHVGMPEASYALAQTAIYLALAPKSDVAGKALRAAREHVQSRAPRAAPAYLRSNVPRDSKEPYDYPHDRPEGVSPQQLLPDGVLGERFYEPGHREPEQAARLAEIERRKRG